MFENRSLKLDLAAIVLLGVVVFLALALFSYDPADSVPPLIWPLSVVYQSDSLVYPANEEIGNACGCWGALAAEALLTSVGLGAYYVLISASILDFILLKRQRVEMPIMRTLGWIASLAGMTTLVAILAPSLSPGPVIGSGGYLGALGAGLLEMHFATSGGLILAASLVIGGLLLCTDYAIFNVAAALTGAAAGSAALFVRAIRMNLSSAEEAEQMMDDEDELAADASEVAVRIRGRRKDDVDDLDERLAALDAESDEQTEGVEDHEDEAETAPPVVVKKKIRQQKKHSKTPQPSFGRKAKDAEREEVLNQLDEADPDHKSRACQYELPEIDLLLESDDVAFDEQEREVRRKATILEKTFAEFGFEVKVVEVETGPVIAQYEIQLEAGLRLAKITGLSDDLAIALRVPSVRIVAPIPGKNTVGIEVPNESRQVVRLREVMEESNAKNRKMLIPLYLGKDVSGNPLVADLATLPHLLIAGRTGTGKSVCLNAIIASMLMTRRPDEVRMLMIDPKMVELSGYGRLPHLMHPVVTDMRKAEAILAWAVEKMEERYALLAKAHVRHITSYNRLGEDELVKRLEPETEEDKSQIPLQLPFIVIVADEMADLMMTAGKEVEQHIIRLAQKSRAVGIHLILATQKPTVDVITGLIKSNLPARISFQVASRTDSRVVLDEMGAEKLLGNGDMLFLWPGTSTLLRGQGTYLSDDEIEAVTDSASTGEQNFVQELVNMKVEQPDEDKLDQLKKRDELYESAVDIVVREGRGSVSLLQRSLGIGYGRAARLVDFMAEDGIVGSYAGSQAREVLITLEDWDRMQGSSSSGDELSDAAHTEQKAPHFSVVDAASRQEEFDEPEDLDEEAEEEDFEDDALAEDDEYDYEYQEEEEEEDEEAYETENA